MNAIVMQYTGETLPDSNEQLSIERLEYLKGRLMMAIDLVTKQLKVNSDESPIIIKAKNRINDIQIELNQIVEQMNRLATKNSSSGQTSEKKILFDKQQKLLLEYKSIKDALPVIREHHEKYKKDIITLNTVLQDIEQRIEKAVNSEPSSFDSNQSMSMRKILRA